ncbi:MAG: hypothetical protein CME26_00190 [Gemmatimonadetes bacterium]|nr:hypothetical protein [Gemmatimonadota bacterium]|tara:strand:- start:5245 stop:6030 length:786 start_codon:yes stop_codon:yes gene_type:complete
MSNQPVVPSDFNHHLSIDNAADRLQEALDVAGKISEAGIDLFPNMDHAAIFVDPPHLLAGPLKALGYIAGWDSRCYPSPVDEQDYINVPSGLPDGHPAAQKGWFRYVAVVHPVDQAARDQMLSQGYGNPFVHHLTWGIVPPDRQSKESNLDYANRLIPYAVEARNRIGAAIGEQPGTLIAALPGDVVNDPGFDAKLDGWMEGLRADDYTVETMQGGGFLVQFFALTGGRIEVALRVDTQQTFNPKSVHKISEDEISTVQND